MGARSPSDVARVAGLVALRELPDGVSVLVRGREVRIERAFGLTVPWIVLRTPICDELDPASVLERNARLAFATIVLAGGVYWLRVALPGDSAELADPARAIALLVDAAVSLVPRYVGHPSAAFDHYAT